MARKTPQSSRTLTKRVRERSYSVAQIRLQIKENGRMIHRLSLKRARILSQLDTVNAEMEALTGNRQPAMYKPTNTMSLGDILVKVLDGHEMTVSQAMDAVLDAGYISTATNFRILVNQRMINEKRIKRVRRGVYTTRAWARR